MSRMRIGKKALSAALALAFLLALLPLAAPARADGDWEYSIEDGHAVITAYNGAGGKVTIPSTLGGKTVTGINHEVFSYCSSLTRVIIPNTINYIGYDAFFACESLVRVDISDLNAWFSMEFGSYYANPLTYARHLYLNGTPVTALTVPAGVTEVNYCLFAGCSDLISLVIPEGVTVIGPNAFCDCDNLVNLSIAKTVTEIGENAFADCDSLTRVTIPNGVTTIGDGAFTACISSMC